MSYLTGKHLPRRTFLQSLGAVVALPYLDAMEPAGLGRAARTAPTHTRLVCIEEVHGLAGCNAIGASKFLYAPETTGKGFTLVPLRIYLEQGQMWEHVLALGILVVGVVATNVIGRRVLPAT